MTTKAKLKTAPKRASKTAKPKRRSLRIEARITPENLAVIKRAAQIQGRSVSDFLVTSAQDAAHRAIEETQIIRLSVEDQRQIAAAILNPPPLTPAMERAIERHRRLVGPL
jgi:uncharacterized protein (DUF1778 family)